MFASDQNTFASDETQDLFALASAYAASVNLSLRTVSRKAAGQGMFFDGLAQGKDVSTARRVKLRKWFETNWRKDAPWPKGIARLPKAKPRKAA